MSPTSIHCILSHIPSFGGAWGGTPLGLGRHPFRLGEAPPLGLGRHPLWAWGGTSSSPFSLEWQSNSKVEGLRITEPSDVIEATLAR